MPSPPLCAGASIDSKEKLSKQEAHTSNVMDRKCFSEEIRLEGTFKVYCKDRGFGFVTPDEGGEDVFVHLKDNPVLPDAQVGDTVTFNKTWDNRKNKCKGCNMVIAGEVLGGSPRLPDSYRMRFGELIHALIDMERTRLGSCLYKALQTPYPEDAGWMTSHILQQISFKQLPYMLSDKQKLWKYCDALKEFEGR